MTLALEWKNKVNLLNILLITLPEIKFPFLKFTKYIGGTIKIQLIEVNIIFIDQKNFINYSGKLNAQVL
jgi:hypothetical protein